MVKKIIDIIKLAKKYKTPNGFISIFKDLNLTIDEGDFITIMGPSGSGKTTLLNIISTIDSNYEGEVYIEGKNLKVLSENEKDFIRLTKIGYLFQFESLINELNVIENIILPSLILNKNKIESAKKIALDLLEKFGLKDISEKKVSELSSGEKQRTALIRAMINSPKILIADEPTGNLDQDNALLIMNDLKKLNKENNITIIIASHNFELTKLFSKKVYKIENKSIKQIL